MPKGSFRTTKQHHRGPAPHRHCRDQVHAHRPARRSLVTLATPRPCASRDVQCASSTRRRSARLPPPRQIALHSATSGARPTDRASVYLQYSRRASRRPPPQPAWPASSHNRAEPSTPPLAAVATAGPVARRVPTSRGGRADADPLEADVQPARSLGGGAAFDAGAAPTSALMSVDLPAFAAPTTAPRQRGFKEAARRRSCHPTRAAASPGGAERRRVSRLVSRRAGPLEPLLVVSFARRVLCASPARRLNLLLTPRPSEHGRVDGVAAFLRERETVLPSAPLPHRSCMQGSSAAEASMSTASQLRVETSSGSGAQLDQRTRPSYTTTQCFAWSKVEQIQLRVRHSESSVAQRLPLCSCRLTVQTRRRAHHLTPAANMSKRQKSTFSTRKAAKPKGQQAASAVEDRLPVVADERRAVTTSPPRPWPRWRRSSRLRTSSSSCWRRR